MKLLEFLKELGCENIQEGNNGHVRATMMNGRLVVEACPNDKNDNMNIKVTDTTRDPDLELSYVMCRKSESQANQKTLSDFKYRIDQLVIRDYKDREKIVLAKNLKVGEHAYTIEQYGEVSMSALVEIAEIEGTEVKCKLLKLNKNYNDFFDVKELDNYFYCDLDQWFTREETGLYCKDGAWNLMELPEDLLITVEHFKTRYELHEEVKAAWKSVTGSDEVPYDEDMVILLTGGIDSIFSLIEEQYHDPNKTSTYTEWSIQLANRIWELKRNREIPVEDSWYL